MRKLSALILLIALSLLVAACQAPTAQVDSELSNVQATIEQAPAAAAPTDTAAPASPTSTTSAANTETASPTPADAAADEGPDPLSVDPDRPGFTLDGSSTLGDAAAPVVFIEFGDFQ